MDAHWAAMLRAAVVRFGLSPDAFWRLSLNEWRALVDSAEEAPLARAGLEALIARYPSKDRDDR